MGKATGFLEFGREEPGHLPVSERVRVFKEFSLPMADADAGSLLPEKPLPPPADDVPRYCRRCRTRLGPHPLDDAETVSNKCLRCGLMYDPARPETYVGKRMPMRWRFWVQFLVVAIVVGVASYAIIFQNGTMGYALFFGVPFAIGK